MIFSTLCQTLSPLEINIFPLEINNFRLSVDIIRKTKRNNLFIGVQFDCLNLTICFVSVIQT